MIALLASFFLGLIAGLISKGININITHKTEQQPVKTEYNESLANLLPNEVKQYYSETNGQNRF